MPQNKELLLTITFLLLKKSRRRIKEEIKEEIYMKKKIKTTFTMIVKMRMQEIQYP